MKNLLCITLFLFAFLFIFISTASATEIVLDPGHHHLGDDFKEELNPGYPEGLVYTAIFTLDPSVDVESVKLTLTGKSIVPGPTDEFSDKIYLNGIEIGTLNNYILAGTPDSDPVNIIIPVHPSLFDPENNTVKISAGSNLNGSNYDDFEFYDLSLHLSEIEPVTLAPPLKVAWTYKFPWRLIDGGPEVEIFAADGILYIHDFIGGYLLALDAETGKTLWEKEEWDGYLEYKDGVLFAVSVYSSTVDALNAKNGELLWSKEYPDISWGNPLIFGNTLFVSTPDDRYVAAIDAEDGTLKWEYEFNITSFETGGRSYYFMSDPLANANIFVSKYHASYSIYNEPVAVDPDEPEPEIEEPEIEEGLVSLDANTGKEVWRYPNLREYSDDPLLHKDLVYVADGDIIALSAESGEVVWKTNTGDWGSIDKVKNNKLFTTKKLFNESYEPVVLDANTGIILEKLPSPKPHIWSSVVTDEYIYSTSGCKINVFDSSIGESVWSSSRIKGSVLSDPTLYRDKLYLVSGDGTLYAFEHGEVGFFFTEGLEDSAILYLPLTATAGMLLLLSILLRKYKNRALVFGSWLMALVGVLLLSFIAIQPYFVAWDIFGMLTFLVLCALGVILLFGIAFLVIGIRKRSR